MNPRREYLVAEMQRIFEVNKLSMAEVKEIIQHQAAEYSEGIHEATNQIANLFLRERLSIEEGNQVFIDCQERFNKLENS